jgi:membrane protease YdiL (CAAX protease family)
MNASRKQIAAFFFLTWLLLALVPVLSLLTGASMDFDAVGARASEATGVPWTSNLLQVVVLCFAEPGLWLLVLGSSVPSLAALLVCAGSGRAALVALLRRFAPSGPGTRAKSASLSYALLVILIPLCLLAVYALRSVLPGPTYTQPEGIFGPALILALLTAAFLDQGGLLEELGWRGYAQPALQERISPLAAAICVGVMWGLWHVPRDVVGGVLGRYGALYYLGLYLPAFLLGTITVSIIAAYFMNRTGGSLWPAIMVHGLTNDAVGLAGKADMALALSPYHQITKALPFLVLCVVLVAVYGRELGRATAPAK